MLLFFDWVVQRQTLILLQDGSGIPLRIREPHILENPTRMVPPPPNHPQELKRDIQPLQITPYFPLKS